MTKDEQIRLEFQVEEMIINSYSSRVTADEIVQLVIDVTEGRKQPKARGETKPWARFAIKREIPT